MTKRVTSHDAEEHFRLVADLSYDWEYWIGPEGEFRYVSPSCERITGYTPDEFMADAGLLARIIHPGDRHLAEQHEQSDNRGKAQTLDYRIIHRDGEERWIGHTCQSMYAPDGTWLGYRASNRDITDARHAQIAREKQAACQQALFAYSQAVLAEDTVEGLLQCTVDAARGLTGANIGSSGHGYRDGAFQVGASSHAEHVMACPDGKVFCVERGGVALDPIYETATLRLTDDELRAHPAWRGLLAGHSPLRGLLGARLVDRGGLATGAIMVSDKEGGGEFNVEDEAVLGQLAAIASLALQHIEARVALERDAARLEQAHADLTATGEALRRQNEALQAAHSQLEAALAQADEGRRTLDALMEYVPEGITLASAPDLQVTRVSRFGQELMGGPHAGKSVQQIIDQWTVYEPDGVTPTPVEELPLVRAIENREVLRDREVLQVNAQGQRIWLSCNAGPIYDSAGNVTGGVVAWRDVTEQKQADLALRASEERYRHLFDGMTEGFALHEIICDADGRPADYRFLEVNAAFEQLTGLNKDDLVGNTVLQVLPETEPFWIETYGRVALTGKPINFEHYAQALDRHYAVSAYRPAENQFACVFLDITDRVSNEQILRENEEKLLALFEILPVGVSILDSNRNIRYLNPALTHTLDLPVEAAGQRRHNQRTYIRADGSVMPADEFPSVRAVREQRTIRDVEIGVVKEDDSLVWTNVSAVPLPFEDWRVILVTADISEKVAARQRIEELATQAKQQAAVLDTMLASIADSVVFYGPDGRISRANAAAHEFFGIPPGEGFRPLSEHVAENRPTREDGTPFETGELLVMRALRGETVAGVNMALHVHPGPPTWASVSAAPVYGPDASLLGAIVSFTDITELRRTRDELEERVQERTHELTQRTEELQRANENLQSVQAELRDQNEALVATQRRVEEEWHRYQELFHFAPDGYLVTTQSGAIVEANRAAGDLLGMPVDRLPGTHLDRYVIPADGPSFSDSLHRLRTGSGGSALRWEMRLQPDEGEMIHAAVAATVSRSMSGEIEGVRWLLRDVTREKQTHEALVHAEKLSIAGQLAASLAHEIKNPLAAAIGCVDLAREAIDGGEDPTQLLGIVDSSLGRASRVVSQLQELHRRSEAEEKQLADLNELVEGVLLLAGKQARSAGVEISWERAEELPALPVMVDGMQQVFLNLVLNAVEAMPDGGHLDVRVRRAHRPARIGIQFSDDGPGVPPGVRHRLFEPFKTTKAKGSGLGLFISHNIVHQHGGSIEVESKEGKGTRFTVWLPE